MHRGFTQLSPRSALARRDAPATRRLLLAVFAAALSGLAWAAGVVPATAAVPGGFLETATSTQVRSRAVPALPSRGPFTFPAPYRTAGIRLTNASDCGGADCVGYVGYSYWRNINNHAGSDTMLVVLALDRSRGGGGPTLFSVNKATDAVTVVGPLFDDASDWSWSTAEGWYFSATRPSALYVFGGPRLYRYDVLSRQFETVFDVSGRFGSHTSLWQAHSSQDDRVHSATLRSNAGGDLGCVVYREDTRQLSLHESGGDFDECQVDRSGRWLLIKENVDGRHGEDNRIIDLQSGAETLFLDEAGAAGHSDSGFGYMVAEDNWHDLPGAVRLWTFGQPLPGAPPQGRLVYHTTDWGTSLGHLSHTNAVAGPPGSQIACGSNAGRAALPRAGEIVCFRLDGSLEVLVVAPVMTSLNAAGGGDDYAKQPKGNLDVTGQYFIWTSNAGGNRLDAFLVKVPTHLLGGGPTIPPPTTPPPTPPSAPVDLTPPTVALTAPAPGATVTASLAVSASASDNVGVVGVQFLRNGSPLGAEVTAPPWTVTASTGQWASGAYTLAAVARDAAGNRTTSAAVSVTVPQTGGGPTTAVTAAVSWIDRVNVTASGSSLRKTTGCDGCADAGAISSQEIGPAGGAVTFRAAGKTGLRFVGLGHGNPGTTGPEIAFALRLQNGIAEVRESGVYLADTRFVPNDVFRIAIRAGVVTYSKNGQPFYQHAVTPTFPLVVDAAIYSRNTRIQNVTLEREVPGN
jgi:hypothetical protein